VATTIPTKPQESVYDPLALWDDPDKDAGHGVLLSDRIRFYAGKVKLIEQFNESHLGPASYDVTLGTECWYADHSQKTGEPKRILAKGETLTLEPNSIVYVSSFEKLNLPFYLVARFNLKLRFLHEGILVGAGPQIDPGFAGRLSCPLHNMSGSNVSLICGEPFAVMEFQKTTPFAEKENWQESEKIADVRARGEARKLEGLLRYPCLTFPTKSLDREPKRYIPAGRLITSSMQELESKQNQLQDAFERQVNEIKEYKRELTIAMVISIVGIGIALGTYFWGSINFYKDGFNLAEQATERVKMLESERDKQKKWIEELQQRVEQMSKSSKTGGDNHAASGPGH